MDNKPHLPQPLSPVVAGVEIKILYLFHPYRKATFKVRIKPAPPSDPGKVTIFIPKFSDRIDVGSIDGINVVVPPGKAKTEGEKIITVEFVEGLRGDSVGIRSKGVADEKSIFRHSIGKNRASGVTRPQVAIFQAEVEGARIVEAGEINSRQIRGIIAEQRSKIGSEIGKMDLSVNLHPTDLGNSPDQLEGHIPRGLGIISGDVPEFDKTISKTNMGRAFSS